MKTKCYKVFYFKSKAQSIAEWGLVIALISVVCIAVLSQVSVSFNTTTSQVNSALNTVNKDFNTTT